MTEGRMALIERIEKSADADLVRELLAYAADRQMALDVEGLTGAPLGARNADRVNHRNGYRERGPATARPSPRSSVSPGCRSLASSPARPRPTSRSNSPRRPSW